MSLFKPTFCVYLVQAGIMSAAIAFLLVTKDPITLVETKIGYDQYRNDSSCTVKPLAPGKYEYTTSTGHVVERFISTNWDGDTPLAILHLDSGTTCVGWLQPHSDTATFAHLTMVGGVPDGYLVSIAHPDFPSFQGDLNYYVKLSLPCGAGVVNLMGVEITLQEVLSKATFVLGFYAGATNSKVRVAFIPSTGEKSNVTIEVNLPNSTACSNFMNSTASPDLDPRIAALRDVGYNYHVNMTQYLRSQLPYTCTRTIPPSMLVIVSSGITYGMTAIGVVMAVYLWMIDRRCLPTPKTSTGFKLALQGAQPKTAS